ncbi:MAG: Tryptophan synthase alpha chain [Myxococcales bacterium]|nr:Tryptophan synthase alpha chain [Myxococcales bacterium]
MRILALLVALAGFAACANNNAGSDCPAGTVLNIPTATCVQCVDSSGCSSGNYCTEQGVCVAGCEAEADCGAGQGCCDHQCVDTTSNPASCGACGVTCGTGQGCCEGGCQALDTLTDCGACGNACASGDFCDGSQCNTPTYPNFCANKTVYVIHDGHTSDNTAADLMASTITANCPPDVMVHTADQTDPMLVDQTTGQPLAGSGVTYVLGGGPFPNMPLKWLERTQDITKIYFDAPDGINFYWRARGTNTAVATMPGSQCSAHKDQFLTELVTDPMSGTLSLVGYGACSGGKGTLAAAWYYANVLLPNKMSYPDSWYVFGWTDQNNNSTPDSGDAFTVLAHGL